MWKYFPEPIVDGVDPNLMTKIVIARERAGIPMIPTSGKRTPEHNAEVGGVADSAHVKGQALDIKLDNSSELFKFLDGCLRSGIRRIVIGVKFNPATRQLVYHNFHMDNDDAKPQDIVSIKLYPWR